MSMDSTAYENMQLRYLLARAKCGCVQRDCSKHGAWDADDVDLYRAVIASDPPRPPDVKPEKTYSMPDLLYVSKVNPAVRIYLDAWTHGVIPAFQTALISMVCRLHEGQQALLKECLHAKHEDKVPS